ncbi:MULTISPECIES: hypothetical protein [unclassified Pseudoalteromonas]|uniref:hypothetical protein n=1 Tax=unclassified Pseudoalteromonas TaxID=194690 RepID=UPI0004072090|nr:MULTISPECIES: hypothetical protein [unclassified Pseudoalteromonas]
MFKSIAVIRGAFNPPNMGHESLIKRLKSFDKILLVPSVAASKGRVIRDYTKRCNMLSLFVKDLDINTLLSYPVEHLINDGNEEYVSNYELLNKIANEFIGHEITLVVGPDELSKVTKLSDYHRIDGRYNVMGLSEQSIVRSETIREKVFRGVDINNDTTALVKSYITNTGLFRQPMVSSL